jgi:hypothetical protein
MYVSKVREFVWLKGQEAIHSKLGSQDVTYLSLHPMPLPPGYRSKVESRHFAHLSWSRDAHGEFAQQLKVGGNEKQWESGRSQMLGNGLGQL